MLLATGENLLHEMGRGKPSMWEYTDISNEKMEANPDLTRGGDQLGKLLMARRDALRAQQSADP